MTTYRIRLKAISNVTLCVYFNIKTQITGSRIIVPGECRFMVHKFGVLEFSIYSIYSIGYSISINDKFSRFVVALYAVTPFMLVEFQIGHCSSRYRLSADF